MAFAGRSHIARRWVVKNGGSLIRHNRFAGSCRRKSDLVLVLDMDECLIHSQFLSNTEYRQDEYRPSAISSKSVESFRIELPDGDLVQVNKRPGLDEFLQTVTSKFETHIFTAAMEVYASPVLDSLDPENTMLDKRFYRESCTLNSELGVYVKDLSKILQDVDHKRVVLVDNNPLSFLAQPSNGILVSNFYDSPDDITLKAVVDLLERLDTKNDVRPTLDDMFGLSAALAELQGRPQRM
mmetsp:Transcript_6824/g.10009  ORF Transcript_6824/g.10009 Transcript_6824/m.10009 type:complete len:239 (-) Transcript_6824:31-747(-)|eukprot:CAMPEP_0196822936 /NCGR_PEP_ID=MMETSP1362-20130617/85447_1 /TAXON_ID=163516 /ORGANISM="Leptocylindrus danicus, Strain CCMP1856" /LENGTH=238 /DNA_ID=CAMNT_0042202641 /DNA_START=164 /DNA_END=880 /DNA_ORIENTATION=+